MRGNRIREILFFEPVFKHTIWGGRKLREDFGYQVAGDDIGECWGIAAHSNGDVTVKNGKYAGMRLSELWQKYPETFGCPGQEQFPLLTKIIDARDDLSIQVHPDDAYAGVNEDGALGKTECWYILDCPADASLIIGHNAESKEEMGAMIQNGEWKDFLREVPVRKGDFIQINPGTLHSVKSGFVILETQQNSDITYRVYDYDRLRNGEKRPLHVRQFMEVITTPSENVENTIKSTIGLPVNKLNSLYSCGYYEVFKLEVDGKLHFEQEYPFLLMSVVEGRGTAGGSEVKKGDHFLIPNGFGKVEVQGNMTIIASTIGV